MHKQLWVRKCDIAVTNKKPPVLKFTPVSLSLDSSAREKFPNGALRDSARESSCYHHSESASQILPLGLFLVLIFWENKISFSGINFRVNQILSGNLFLIFSGWEEWGAFPQFENGSAQSGDRWFVHTPE